MCEAIFVILFIVVGLLVDALGLGRGRKATWTPMDEAFVLMTEEVREEEPGEW